MEGFKQFLKIIGIVLACLLGVFVLLCVLTAIIPSFYVFGYKFVLGSTRETEKIIDYQEEANLSLNIHTENYSVNLIADKELEGLVSYSYAGSYFGFANMSSSRLIVTEDIGELSFSMREPSGLLIKSGSEINIHVNPEVVYDINFVSDSGSLCVSDLVLNKINIISGTGDVRIETTEQKDKESENDEDTLEEIKFVQNLACLNITADDGFYDFSSYDEISVLGTSNISIGNGELKFKDLNSSLNIRGKKCSITADNIISPEGISMVCSDGVVSAKIIDSEMNEIVVISDNLSFSADKVIGQVGITATGGKIAIKEILGDSIIKTTTANISVEKANNNIFATATSGNILVEKYYEIGQFVTTSGNITVNSLSEYNENYYSTIASKNGSVSFENKVNKSSVSITEDGVAKIKIWSVAQTGNVEHDVFVPNGEASIGIMAYATDIFRLRIVGEVSGSINSLIVYANDNYIYHPGDSTEYSNEATFTCNGKFLYFSKLDEQ